MRPRNFNLKTDLAPVVTLFELCFGEAPWFERFITRELMEWFTDLASQPDTIFLVIEDNGRIVGCSIAHALTGKSDVAELVDEDSKRALYMAELFVHPDYRKHGIGVQLTMERFRIGWEQGYRRAVVRTSVEQGIIRSLYCDKYGFCVVNSQDVLSTQWIDGEEREVPVTRVIMTGAIPVQIIGAVSA
jgi:ribosomal protein S18 acetylase RimI-like enzyme